MLSNGRMRIIGVQPLRVGRLDSIVPSPPGQPPAGDASLDDILAFWAARGFTEVKAVALTGSQPRTPSSTSRAASGAPAAPTTVTPASAPATTCACLGAEGAGGGVMAFRDGPLQARAAAAGWSVWIFKSYLQADIGSLRVLLLAGGKPLLQGYLVSALSSSCHGRSKADGGVPCTQYARFPFRY